MPKQNVTPYILSPVEVGVLNTFKPNVSYSMTEVVSAYSKLHSEIERLFKAERVAVTAGKAVVLTALRTLFKNGYLEIFRSKDYPNIQFRLSKLGLAEVYQI